MGASWAADSVKCAIIPTTNQTLWKSARTSTLPLRAITRSDVCIDTKNSEKTMKCHGAPWCRAGSGAEGEEAGSVEVAVAEWEWDAVCLREWDEGEGQ